MALGRDTISQRIALEGSEEIRKQLDAIAGVAGDTFKRLQEATQTPNTGLAGLSDSINKFKASAAVGLKEVGDHFGRISTATQNFGHHLTEVGDKIFPHFREVLAVGLGLSVAGFIELAHHASETAQRIDQAAKLTGLTTTEFQALANAAKAAGVDQDTLTQSLGRLNKALGEAVEKSRDNRLQLGAQLFKDVDASGVTVLGKIRETGAKIVEVSSETINKLRPIAKQLYDEYQSGAKQFLDANQQRVIPSLDAILQKLVQLNSTQGGEALRKTLDAEGIIIPAKTVGEVFDRMRESSGDMLSKLRALGVRITEFGADGQKHTRPLLDILKEFAISLDALPDKQLQAAKGSAILSRGWQNLVKVLMEFNGDTHKLVEEFTRLNVVIEGVTLEAGQKLDAALTNAGTAAANLKTNLVLAFAPVLIPLLEAFQAAISNNAKGLQEFAKGLAESVRPALEDFASLMKGVNSEHLQTDFVKSLVKDFNLLKSVFTGLFSALDVLATKINGLFGTELSGRTLLIIGLLIQMSGVLGLVGAAMGLILALGPWGLLAVAIIAVAAACYVFSDSISAWWKETAPGWLKDLVTLFGDLGKAIGTITFGELGRQLELVLGAAKAVSDAIQSIYEKIQAIKNSPIPSKTFEATVPGGPADPGTGGDYGGGSDRSQVGGLMAEGGLIRGPGSATSDSVLIGASNGEFMQRAAAVSFWGLDFMEAINSMRLPKFATGGAIGSIRPSAIAAASAGPSSSVTLVIGEDVYSGLTAPERVAARLGRHAGARRVTSAGRKPSWKN